MGEQRGWLEHGGERLAWRAVELRGPTVVWLGGFRSDMTGTKAEALAEWAAANGRAFLRFDYSGHGESSGEFADGTIGRWREDALAVIDARTEGPLLLVGSSMGGWIASLVALARPERLAGLVLIAPAPDFTETLMWARFSEDQRRAVMERGAWDQPSEYGGTYPITRALIEDGRRWLLMPERDSSPVPITAPVRILQGGADAEVPWRHALAYAEALAARDVVFSLIKDGDHRLSRPHDIARLIGAVMEFPCVISS
jgi:pimeloyl-ACP methyl ester carboxylesterase